MAWIEALVGNLVSWVKGMSLAHFAIALAP